MIPQFGMRQSRPLPNPTQVAADIARKKREDEEASLTLAKQLQQEEADLWQRSRTQPEPDQPESDNEAESLAKARQLEREEQQKLEEEENASIALAKQLQQEDRAAEERQDAGTSTQATTSTARPRPQKERKKAFTLELDNPATSSNFLSLYPNHMASLGTASTHSDKKRGFSLDSSQPSVEASDFYPKHMQPFKVPSNSLSSHKPVIAPRRPQTFAEKLEEKYPNQHKLLKDAGKLNEETAEHWFKRFEEMKSR